MPNFQCTNRSARVLTSLSLDRKKAADRKRAAAAPRAAKRLNFRIARRLIVKLTCRSSSNCEDA